MAKRKFTPVTSLDEALAAFIEGARIHHAGAYLQNNQMAIDGILRTNQGLEFIDTQCPTARDVLLPLLGHKEDVVQITAASALIPSHMDLALAMIEHVQKTSITEAFGSACMILTTCNVFGDYLLSLCADDPRYPPPGQRPREMIRIQKSRLARNEPFFDASSGAKFDIPPT